MTAKISYLNILTAEPENGKLINLKIKVTKSLTKCILIYMKIWVVKSDDYMTIFSKIVTAESDKYKLIHSVIEAPKSDNCKSVYLNIWAAKSDKI